MGASFVYVGREILLVLGYMWGYGRGEEVRDRETGRGWGGAPRDVFGEVLPVIPGSPAAQKAGRRVQAVRAGWWTRLHLAGSARAFLQRLLIAGQAARVMSSLESASLRRTSRCTGRRRCPRGAFEPEPSHVNESIPPPPPPSRRSPHLPVQEPPPDRGARGTRAGCRERHASRPTRTARLTLTPTATCAATAVQGFMASSQRRAEGVNQSQLAQYRQCMSTLY